MCQEQNMMCDVKTKYKTEYSHNMRCGLCYKHSCPWRLCKTSMTISLCSFWNVEKYEDYCFSMINFLSLEIHLYNYLWPWANMISLFIMSRRECTVGWVENSKVEVFQYVHLKLSAIKKYFALWHRILPNLTKLQFFHF